MTDDPWTTDDLSAVDVAAICEMAEQDILAEYHAACEAVRTLCAALHGSGPPTALATLAAHADVAAERLSTIIAAHRSELAVWMRTTTLTPRTSPRSRRRIA